MPLSLFVRLIDEVDKTLWVRVDRVEAVWIDEDNDLQLELASGEAVVVKDTPENRQQLGLQ